MWMNICLLILLLNTVTFLKFESIFLNLLKEFERLGANEYKDVIGSKHDLVTLRYQLQRMKPVFSSVLEEFQAGHGYLIFFLKNQTKFYRFFFLFFLLGLQDNNEE